MTDQNATLLIEWKSTDGSERCLLMVIDNDKDPKDVKHKKFELCTLDGEEWKTDERVDFVEEITGVGIPETFGN